ncbi:MAG: succinylglutamate desuccinylase/aspartoacylase family protein [Candidatus Bathyarchaeia archaeon]
MKLGFIKGIELCDGTRVDIPIIVVNGSRDGPILLLMSTQHGDEIQGIEVIRQVTRVRVDPKKLNGSIIGIPVGNPLAFQHGLYTSWIDNADIGEVKADRPEGSTTERLANVIWEQAFSKADYIINIHCNINTNALAFQSADLRVSETKEKLEKMITAFGVTAIDSEEEPLPKEGLPTFTNLAMTKGIPVLFVELFDGKRISKLSVETGVRGVLNVMKALEMIEGKVEKQRGIRVVRGRNKFYGIVHSNHGGLLHLEKEPGEKIKKGEVIARIYNLHGDVVESVKMPVDGYVWAYPFGTALGTCTGVQAVHTGDFVAYVFVSEKA